MLVPEESNRFRLRVAIAILPAMAVAFVLLARATRSPGNEHRDLPEPPGSEAESPPRDAAMPLVRLIAPSGVFRNPPGLFLWDAVPGASSYRLTVLDQDMIWPLARRDLVEK